MLVNGKEYPLWGKIIENKEKFIGKILVDNDMGMNMETIVTDINLRATGENSAFFEIIGKDFTCGFDVEYGGISLKNKGIITFSGFQGHIFFIK